MPLTAATHWMSVSNAKGAQDLLTAVMKSCLLGQTWQLSISYNKEQPGLVSCVFSGG